MKPWTEPEKLMNFLSKEAGPQLEISRKIACMIHACLNEVEQLAAHQGQMEQDVRSEQYEWCRLVAMIIEMTLQQEKEIGN